MTWVRALKASARETTTVTRDDCWRAKFPRRSGARAASETTDDDFAITAERECAKMVELGEAECEKLATEHAARWRSMPKRVKEAPLTEFADDLKRDGSEEAMAELIEVNKVLATIDETLVR